MCSERLRDVEEGWREVSSFPKPEMAEQGFFLFEVLLKQETVLQWEFAGDIINNSRMKEEIAEKKII